MTRKMLITHDPLFAIHIGLNISFLRLLYRRLFLEFSLSYLPYLYVMVIC